jgi:hypothetical protein
MANDYYISSIYARRLIIKREINTAFYLPNLLLNNFSLALILYNNPLFNTSITLKEVRLNLRANCEDKVPKRASLNY